jgi:tripartite-type tricarboxylate transporter receptor subunit TctC
VGAPTYLGVRSIQDKAGASFTHVPYKGMSAAMQDFLGGRLDFMLSDPALIKPYIESGKARALAISAKSPLFPDVPVWTDMGLPGVPQSFSLMAPASTPDAIAQAMSRAVMQVLQDPATRQQITNHGFVPVIDTPAQLKAERAMWKALIERNDIRLD